MNDFNSRICPSCRTDNQADARFCNQCGVNLYSGQKDNGKANLVDLFIFLAIAISFFEITSVSFMRFVFGYRSMSMVSLYINALYFISSIASMALVFLIQNKALKIVGIVMASIYMAFIIYRVGIYYLM